MADRIADARKRLEERWDAQGMCRSCGWHAALYEHNIWDADIAEALNEQGGILNLSCLSDDDPDGRHRGVRVDLNESTGEGSND